MKIRLLINIFFFLFISSAVFAQAPVNDDPCNATPLTAGIGCNYVTGTTLNATATAGVPAPGCANYVGGDVWFSVIVPASGSLIFDSNTGVVTDGGMAIYSGTCNSLTLISCDDDGSANGLMPSISANGLTPGSTIYIRFWEYGNDNNGDFSICVEQITPCATVSTNSSCASADPFCTGTSYNYCNTVNVPSLGGGGIYGCCLSTPNPAFYFMNIQSTGPITFNISQNTNAGVGIDVDFVLWGPFASQAAMCTGLGAGNIVDCSYSTAAIETATIPNATAGQWYMMLITNFSNQPGNIQFSQTNSNTVGAGSTNCNILTAVPGPCTNGLYTLTGSVDVPAPPTTGTLTVSSSCGGSAVFNAPFITPITYSIPNICATGNTCTASAVFSAPGSPTILPTAYTASTCNTLTATPTPCSNGTYSVNGVMTAYCLPSTGTLTFTTSCGGSVTYNAPFSSPFNYSISGITGSGGACSVTAVFSAANSPLIPVANYTGSTCCGANAGTISVTATNGSISTNGNLTNVVLCPGGGVNIISNNDYVLPPSFDPGWDDSELFLAIYNAGGPTTNDPSNDPNWTGYYWTAQDFSTANSGGYSSNSNGGCSPILSLPGLTTTGNTLVFVPLTADDGDNGLNWNDVVNHDQDDDGCFDLGDPVAVTFLDPITVTSTPSCGGSVSMQFFGGLPQIGASSYSITNTGAGVLSQATVNYGGSVTITGLTNGQTYSVSVVDGNGCTSTYSGTYSNTLTATISPATSTICQGSCVTLTGSYNSNGGNVTFSPSQCIPSIPDALACNGGPANCPGGWSSSSIVVNGVCDPTWDTGDYLSVCLNITHTWVSDVQIWLQAPNGVYYLLSRNNGGSGDNYTGTCFTTNAVTAITAGLAPFIGSYLPQGGVGNFAAFNGTPTNGTWTLFVGDVIAGDVGVVNSWSISFQNPNTVTYSWSPANGLSATNVLTPSACPSSSTTYTLTVTNACGCTATATVPITVIPPVTPTFNSIGPICSGATVPALPTTSTNGISGTWSPSTINNTTTGTYTFSPTAGQCADTITITVVIDNAPTLSSVITNPLCLGNTNGSINLSVTGGTAPFTYLWSNGAVIQDISSLAVGTYTVTVSSANGCTSVLSNVVSAPLAVVASITSTTNINCFGQSTGAVAAIGSGGTSPYTYLWSTGATTNAISNLPAGVYTVTVTDANGCTNNTNVSATLLQQPQLTVNLPLVTNVSCFGGSNGSITASSTGGTAGYNYSWSTGATGPTASGLTIGTYTVTVTDSRGCTNTASTTISQPSQLLISIPSSTNVLCNGGTTGSATAFAASGTPGYTYLWSNGGNTATVNNLTAGPYVVTATDANGCTISTSVTITQPTLLAATIPTTTNVLCNGGSTGSASASALGGIAGYTFLWNTGSISSSISNLTAGTYTVTATDANGCTSSASTNISQPTLLVVSIPSTTNVLCNGGATGSATASASNGTPIYSYAWNTGATTATISNLLVGTYTVTATDANGCTNTASTTLSQPAAITLTPSSTTSTCGQANGSVGVTVAGGLPNYSYLWSSGQTTAAINNVASGGYVVTVTDANGCSASTTANVGSIGGPTVTLANSTDVSCFGGTNGSAQVTVSSGAIPFSYSWLPSGGSGASASNLAAGNYTVNVTDANGCTSSVSVVITQPSLLTLSIPSTTNVLCNGGATGSATALAANGTAGYSYQWNTGATTSTINNLIAGTYTVTATDANGCTTSTTATITQPSLLTLSIPSTTNVLCNGGATGSATALASNGTAGYSYLWNTGATTPTINNLTAGTYTVTATDANGCTISTTATITQPSLLTLSIPTTTNVLCNGGATGSATALAANGTAGYSYQWNTGATTSTINNLTAGTYTVTATDANGCTTSTTATITQPSLLTLSIPSSTNVLCNGGATGSATALASNGTAGYSYLWSNGSTNALNNNLTAGTYTVTATDANGCTTSTTSTITQPSALAIAIPSTTNVLCNGGATGSATALASNGTAGYTYLWSNGSTNTINNNLTTGTYTVTATDANGCSTATTATITQPTPLAISIPSTTNVLCNGGATGSATALASNGTVGYSYLWNNGSTTATINNLTAGTYTVTATDANGCSTSTTATITQPSALAIAIPSSTNVLCNGGATGSATALASNGTAGYSYLWSNGSTNALNNNLTAGTYTVTATDANGCTTSTSTTITQPSALAIAIPSTTNVLCNGGATGSATALASNGTAGYAYLWSNGSTTSTINNLAAGTYTVTATDASGCTISTSAIITQPSALTVTIPVTTNVLCNGGTTGSATAIASNGSAGYNYLWNSGATTPTVNNLIAGNYTVTATDANGCTITATTVIAQPSAIILSGNSTSTLCGQLNGSASVNASGGTGAYAYLWSSAQTTSSISNVASGGYVVTVTDANGCTNSTSINVGSIGGPTVAIASSTNVSCFNGSNGSAQVNVSSGTGPFTYAWLPNGGNSNAASNLTAGSYSVNVTDINGCTSSASILITQPSQLTIAIPSTINVLCNGGATGSATALASNGTSGYSYLWSNGSTSATINNLSAGTYTVTATDGNGCSASSSAIITQPSLLTVTIPSSSNILCNGAASGSATALASNGTTGYSYLWSNGGVVSTISNLTAGTYVVTATDGNGCTASSSVTITQPSILNIQTSGVAATCGQLNGSASVNVLGGTSGYAFQWSNGQTSSTINNLATGFYTVTVTDANACTASVIINVGNIGGPSVAISSYSNVGCFGGATGTAQVNVSLGTSPYTYNWLPTGGTASNTSNLTAGNYTVVVTDANGCTTSTSLIITEPSALGIQTSTTSSSCGQLNGSASIVVSGGVAGYNYQWSSGQTTSSINNVSAGGYTVTVIDANGCTSAASVNIGTIGGPAVAIANSSNVTCFGGSNGSAQVNVSAGVAPFTYSWIPSGGNSANASNLTAGNYTVNVTDANGCSNSVSISITEPSSINLNTSSISSSCGQLNGSATVNASGGIGALSYLWNGGQTTNSINNIASGNYSVTVTDANGCTSTTTLNVGSIGGPTVAIANSSNVSCFGGSNGSAQVNVSSGTGPYSYNWLPSGGNNASAINLNAGNYNVNVTDANGCISSVSVLISEPTALSLQTSNTQASCGQANGSATVNVSGGVSGYSYLWSNTQTSSTINSVLSGAYSVTVTDANGCTATTAVNVGSIGGPTVAIASSNNVTCNGGSNGSAQVTVSAGIGPYTYSWIPSGGSSASAFNLTAGNYSMNVTDANGCISSTSVTITEPTAINIQTASTQASCGQANGSASVNASGGTGAYTYLWSNAQTSSSISNIVSGGYTVTVTDANGCSNTALANVSSIGGPTVAIASSTNVSCFGGSNGSAQVNVSAGTGPFTYSWLPSGGNSTSATNLIAGNYTVNVTDNNGCTSSTSIVITQPTQLSITIPNATNVLCNGGNTGSATALASNGTAGYAYMWSNGSTNATINNLTVGTYTVTATDANGCTSITNTSILQPSLMSLSNINSQNVSCYGLSDGSASLNANGGTTPYSYSWNPVVSNNNSAINLPAGNYNLLITDANGCTLNQQYQITQPSAIVVNPSINDVACFGGNNGSISVAVNGGSNPYTYSWSTGASATSVTGLATGNYTLTITDANGCTDANTWSVNEPSDISAAITHSDVSCYGLSDGTIQVNANGGTPGYQISWTPNQSGFNLTNLPAGNYSAVITDANGCTHALLKSIVQPSQIVVNASTPTTLCIGQSQTLSLLVSGGSPAYTYLWSNQQTTPSINVSPAVTTNYSVVVTDINGCTASLNNLLVNVHPPLQLNISATNDTICLGQSLSLAANASGGNGGPYTYNWNNGINTTSQMITPSTTGVYSVSVSDGCTTPNAQQSLTIVVNPVPAPAFTPGNIQGCSPVSASFNLSAGSGAGNTYLWSFGDNTTSTLANPTHQYAGAGSYNVTLTVTNQYGCAGSVTNNNVVNVYALPIAKFTPDPSETQLLTANINFNNYSVGAAYYNWSFGDNTTSTDFSPSHMFSDTGLYQVRLIATSLQQCRDTAYEYVHIVGSFTFWCPNAFSPNNDLKNDGFTGYGVGIKSATFVIFNRWGEKIYTSDNLANPWDGTFWNNGTRCPEDVYVYLFDVVSEDNEHHKYTGRVSLVK